MEPVTKWRSSVLECCGRYLRSVEQKERTRVRGGSDSGNPHVRGQGLPACQRIIRIHRRPEIQHRRPGLPSVRVRPLADSARRSTAGGHQAIPDRAGHKVEKGIETRQRRPWKLSGQIVIETRKLLYPVLYVYFVWIIIISSRSWVLLYFHNWLLSQLHIRQLQTFNLQCYYYIPL